jgi:8-oxo-dGTP diphosphatase
MAAQTKKGAALPSEHQPIALTVDCVVFGCNLDAHRLEVLLIERGLPPFEGSWALPGGFVRDETLEQAASRELGEEAGLPLKSVFLEQLYTFGALDRDPRGRVVSVAYMALVRPSDYQLAASTDARRAAWFPMSQLPPLAFDHAEVVRTAARRLRGKVRYQPIGFALLPEEFSLPELQHLYEITLEQTLDRRNFQRKILNTGLLRDTGRTQQGVPHRAARLYTFDRERYEALEAQGFELALP